MVVYLLTSFDIQVELSCGFLWSMAWLVEKQLLKKLISQPDVLYMFTRN